METDYGYDSMGRQNRVQDPDGDITRTFYDARGLKTEVWQGTDDTPTAGTWTDWSPRFRK